MIISAGIPATRQKISKYHPPQKMSEIAEAPAGCCNVNRHVAILDFSHVMTFRNGNQQFVSYQYFRNLGINIRAVCQ